MASKPLSIVTSSSPDAKTLLSHGVMLKTGETRASPMDARRRDVLDRLMREAETLLTDFSVDEIALSEILQRANVAKATFYKLFEDLPHFYQFVAEGLQITLRGYQLESQGAVDPDSWRSVLGGLCEVSVKFYTDHPAAMRLWLATDSPASIRANDQAADATFLAWMYDRYSGADWHRRLPKLPDGLDVLTVSFRIYDAVLALAFQRRGGTLPAEHFEEAKRASFAYVATHLDASRKRGAK